MSQKTEAGRRTKKAPGSAHERKNSSAPDTAPTAATATTKAARIVALLRQPQGATLQAVMSATGWQPHSVRGFISAQLVKKRKLHVKSFKRAGERVYKIPG